MLHQGGRSVSARNPSKDPSKTQEGSWLRPHGEGPGLCQRCPQKTALCWLVIPAFDLKGHMNDFCHELDSSPA